MADTDTTNDQVSMSRRGLVRAVGAGVVVLAGTHLGVAYEASQWAQQEPKAKNDALSTELERLRGLVSLYESLDKVGVDAIVGAGIKTVQGLLDATRGGLNTLANGMTVIESVLNSFQKSFATLREGLSAVESLVTTIATLLGNTQKFIGDVTSPVKPLALQIKEFFDKLLGMIPFGVGDNIRQAIDAQIALVNELPNFVLMLNTRLLEPLRATWLSDQTAQNLQGALIDPITKNAIEPGRALLKNFDQTLAQWESNFHVPVQAALDQRATIRQQIVEYRKQHGLS